MAYEDPQIVQEWLDSLNELDVKDKKNVRLLFRESLKLVPMSSTEMRQLNLK